MVNMGAVIIEIPLALLAIYVIRTISEKEQDLEKLEQDDERIQAALAKKHVAA